MFKAARILFIYVETPLHAGSGRGMGAIDLPIQRERTSNYPMVQASGVKGALRADIEDRFGNDGKEAAISLFGPRQQADHAGAVSPGDARLLLFPVRSLSGVFAWATSVHALERFRRDAQAAGETLAWTTPAEPDKNSALTGSKCKVLASGRVVLEEYAFTPSPNHDAQAQVDAIATWIATQALPGQPEYDYWRKVLPGKLIVLPEDAFRDFTLFATEQATRIKLNVATKTVDKEQGALWVEESLPVDTLMYSIMACADLRKRREDLATPVQALDYVAKLNGARLQLGGDETVGRGVVALRFGATHHLVGAPAAEGNHA